MMDALTVYGFVATMRHAGYLSFAAAVLGLVEAHYPSLRNVVLRAKAWLVSTWGAAIKRSSEVPRRRVSAETCTGSTH